MTISHFHLFSVLKNLFNSAFSTKIPLSAQVAGDPGLRVENEKLKRRITDLAESNSVMEARLEDIERRLSGDLTQRDEADGESEADKTTMSKAG